MAKAPERTTPGIMARLRRQRGAIPVRVALLTAVGLAVVAGVGWYAWDTNERLEQQVEGLEERLDFERDGGLKTAVGVAALAVHHGAHQAHAGLVDQIGMAQLRHGRGQRRTGKPQRQ